MAQEAGVEGVSQKNGLEVRLTSSRVCTYRGVAYSHKGRVIKSHGVASRTLTAQGQKAPFWESNEGILLVKLALLRAHSVFRSTNEMPFFDFHGTDCVCHV